MWHASFTPLLALSENGHVRVDWEDSYSDACDDDGADLELPISDTDTSYNVACAASTTSSDMHPWTS